MRYAAKTTIAFCGTCNKAQPAAKAYVVLKSGRVSKARAPHCMICHERVFPAQSKFGNVPTASKHSLGPSGKPRVFHSKRERNREPVLLALQNVGAIADLKYQVKFHLEVYSTPAVDALLDELESSSFSAAAFAVRRSRYRVCSYIADFTYRRDGQLVVEDPKGPVTNEYRIKKRLMRVCHDIEIQEPSEGGVEQRARGAGIAGRGTGSRFSGGKDKP